MGSVIIYLESDSLEILFCSSSLNGPSKYLSGILD